MTEKVLIIIIFIIDVLLTILRSLDQTTDVAHACHRLVKLLKKPNITGRSADIKTVPSLEKIQLCNDSCFTCGEKNNLSSDGQTHGIYLHWNSHGKHAVVQTNAVSGKKNYILNYGTQFKRLTIGAIYYQFVIRRIVLCLMEVCLFQHTYIANIL